MVSATTGAGESASSCPFCAIVAGDDPDAVVIGEGADWIAIFPKAPATPGHTLIIPRRHVPDFWSLEGNLAGVLAQAAILLGQAIQAAVKPEGMNLITSKGLAAEQTVRHVHLHVLPRWEDDAVDAIWPPASRCSTRLANTSRPPKRFRRAPKRFN